MSGKRVSFRVTRVSAFAWVGCAFMALACGSARADGMVVPPPPSVSVPSAPVPAGDLVPTVRLTHRVPLAERTLVRHVQLTVNKSQVIRVGVPVGDVLVGASDIADVLPVSNESLYVLGKKVGTTNVTLFDSDKRLVGIVDVTVAPDVSSVQADVTQRTGDPGLRVRASGDKLVLTGTAHDAVSVDQAMQVAPPGTVNLTQVASPQQVMLRVRFIEVDRSAGRDLGVSWGFNTGAVNRSGTNIFGNPSSVGFATTGGTVGGPSGGTANFTAVGPDVPLLSAISGTLPFMTVIQKFGSNMDVAISALENKGLARALAEPNLVASSGETAQFLAGGEIPIPVSSTTFSGVPQITVDYKKYGVSLKFTPTVLANGEIHLHLAPEVSEIDPTLTVTEGGISIPALTDRSAETGITLRDGQSFAMAGLLQDITQRDVNQLPWLGNVPVIGALFRSAGYLQHETELVVIVTPRLVKPAKPGDVLTDPLESTVPADDPDLFLEGKVEVEKKRINAIATAHGIALFGHVLPPANPTVAGAKP